MSKAAKRRHCPVVSREITSAECGQNRNTRYACPADCGFNPFAAANYTHFLELEEKVDNVAGAWLLRNSPNRVEINAQLTRLYKLKAIGKINSLFVLHLFFRRDDQGKTGAELFQASGFPGLKNDEILLFQAKMSMRFRGFEIHRVIDREQCEVADLIDPTAPPEIILDRSLAARSLRFTTYLGWAYRLPHFVRLSGAALTIPMIGGLEPVEIAAEVVAHLGGPRDHQQMLPWIGEHYAEFEDAMSAIYEARRRKMFTGSDTKAGRAIYELRRPFLECRQMLDSHEEIEIDSLSGREEGEGFAEARIWFEDEASSVEIGPGRTSLGRVLLGQTIWRIETIGAARLATLRNRFERLLENRVHFKGERVDNLGERLMANEPPINESLVPPRLIESTETMQFSTTHVPLTAKSKSNEELEADFWEGVDRNFLKDRIPALNNHTPREAAANPAFRPKLIRLMKDRVNSNDERNLAKGKSRDINWMLIELGLTEILFDPPPPRPIPEGLRSEEEELQAMPKLPPAPRLSGQPLSFEQMQARVAKALDLFPDEEDALTEIRKSGGTIVDDLKLLTQGLIQDEHFDCLLPVLLELWFALVPLKTKGPRSDPDSLRERFDTESSQLIANKGAMPSFDFMIGRSPQPILLRELFGSLSLSIKERPVQHRPDWKNQVLLALLLKIVIDELHEALG